MRTIIDRAVVRWAIALLVIFVAAVLHWALIPVMGSEASYWTLYPAVILVAIVFGLWPALLGGVLGIAVSEIFLTPPFTALGPAVAVIFVALIAGYFRQRLQAFYEAAQREAVAARAAEKRLADVLESMSDAFLSVDADLHVRAANTAAIRLSGKRPGEMLGRTLEEITGREQQADHQCRLLDALVEHRSVRFEEYFEATSAWLEVDVYPQEDGLAVFYRDITERKKAQERIRELALVVEKSSDFIGIASLDGRGIYLNPAGRALVGLESEEAVRERMVEEYLFPEDLPFVRETVLPTVLREGRWAGEFRFRHFQTGEPIAVFWDVYRVNDPETGKPVQMATVTRDIRKQKAAAEALARARRISERSLAQLHAVLGTVNEGLLVANADGEIVLINPAMLAILGTEELAEENVQAYADRFEIRDPRGEVIRPEQWPLPRALLGETVRDQEGRISCRETGEVFEVLASAAPVCDNQGNVMLAVLTMRDISERKRAEEALRLSEERFRVALTHSPICVYTVDCELRYTWIYNALDDMPVERMLGKRDEELLPWEAVAPLVEFKRAVLSAGQGLRRRISTVIHGRQFMFDVTAEPLRNAAGEIEGLTVAVMDVTELMQLKTSADEANEAKSRFLANISHELRTPMNAIMGMTKLALQEELSPSVRDGLETVQTSADALLALLDELLDFSRIEAGGLALESVPLSVRDVVNDTLKVLGVRAREKGLELRAEIAPQVPEAVLGDPLRLRQILTNLAGNAVKFTERGEVVIRIAAQSIGSEEARLKIEVSDTGIGIAPEHQAMIFSPFTQADASTSRKFGGSGLGLAITSSLVKLMGGDLRVKSEPGVGSTFFFTASFPQAAASDLPATKHAEEPAAHISRPLQVLLAEDTPANQKLIVRILQKRGHQVEVANNGREALEKVRRQPFDVVLMDVQMPIMDGFAATAALRTEEDSRLARIPVVAMTAHAMKGDKERCLAAGMDAYLPKPINAEELVRVIEDLVAAPA